MEIKISNLSKIYGSNPNSESVASDTVFYALHDIHLTIKSGEYLAVAGPSGSGKSTLLHVMSGLDFPSTGTVWMDNVNIFTMNDSKLSEFRRRYFGFIFQQFNLIPNLTVKENIELPLLFEGKRLDKKIFDSICSELEIGERINYLPSKLSGGQQQRVAIARAIISDPEIIFADEPTGNLDQDTSNKVMSLLRKIAISHKKTLIIVTHNENIATTADRIVTIIDGKIA